MGGEVRFPQPRSELSDAGGRMLADTLQDIGEIRVRIDSVQSTGEDQALHDANVRGTEFGPAEVPVPAPHRNGAQRALLP